MVHPAPPGHLHRLGKADLRAHHNVTWLACTTGMIACLPFVPQLVGELGTAAPASIAWLVYLGLFPVTRSILDQVKARLRDADRDVRLVGEAGRLAA